jgi:hypothetical protein
MRTFEMSPFYILHARARTHTPDYTSTLAAYLSNRFTTDCNRLSRKRRVKLIFNYHVSIFNLYFGLNLYLTEKSVSLSYKEWERRDVITHVSRSSCPASGTFVWFEPTSENVQRFYKTCSIWNCTEIRPVGVLPFYADIQTDGRTYMARLMVIFRNLFKKAPNKDVTFSGGYL